MKSRDLLDLICGVLQDDGTHPLIKGERRLAGLCGNPDAQMLAAAWQHKIVSIRR